MLQLFPEKGKKASCLAIVSFVNNAENIKARNVHPEGALKPKQHLVFLLLDKDPFRLY